MGSAVKIVGSPHLQKITVSRYQPELRNSMDLLLQKKCVRMDAQLVRVVLHIDATFCVSNRPDGVCCQNSRLPALTKKKNSFKISTRATRLDGFIASKKLCQNGCAVSKGCFTHTTQPFA